jgi:hypothetical protein
MRTTIQMLLAACSIAIAASGCATSFTGDAHIAGPTACQAKCREWGMDLTGMVAMGEYSDACICRIRGKGASGDETAAAAGAGAVGVVLQTRSAQQHNMVMGVH